MSIKHLLSVLLLAGLSIFGASSANAQIFSRGDLFGPGALPPMFSIEAGLGQHVQSGTFDCDCGAVFEGLSANGFLANLMYELPLDYSWIVGIKAGIDFKGLKGSQLMTENFVVTFADKNDSLAVKDGKFDRTNKVDLTYLGVVPFVKYQFSRVGAFVQMGPSIQFLVSSHILHRRELLSPYTINRAEEGQEPDIVPIKFNNGERFEILQDEEITTANGTRISLQLTGGYDFELSDHSLISPMITYELPFTTVRDDLANDWKVTSIYGSVAIKFRLD